MVPSQGRRLQRSRSALSLVLTQRLLTAAVVSGPIFIVKFQCCVLGIIVYHALQSLLHGHCVCKHESEHTCDSMTADIEGNLVVTRPHTHLIKRLVIWLYWGELSCLAHFNIAKHRTMHS